MCVCCKKLFLNDHGEEAQKSLNLYDVNNECPLNYHFNTDNLIKDGGVLLKMSMLELLKRKLVVVNFFSI